MRGRSSLCTLFIGSSRNVRIIGMTYYVPELAEWLSGPTGQAFAEASVEPAVTFNGLLSNV